MGLFSRKPAVPRGFRVYAIGDIHGCADLLARLMRMIETDAAAHPAENYRLIFLGDYIDRGLSSRAVLDFILKDLPQPFTPIFLRGNHDERLMRVLDGDLSGMDAWLTYGGMATLGCYSITPGRPTTDEQRQSLRSQLLQKIPPSHRAFLESTQYGYSCGDYFFVHAGVRPGVSIAKQSKKDLMWIRHDFLRSQSSHGKIIVHGHTIAPKAEVLPNRIGIDTGAFASGHLTCLVLDGSKQSFLST